MVYNQKLASVIKHFRQLVLKVFCLVSAGLPAEDPRVGVGLWDHDHERAPVRLRRMPGCHVSERERIIGSGDRTGPIGAARGERARRMLFIFSPSFGRVPLQVLVPLTRLASQCFLSSRTTVQTLTDRWCISILSLPP